MCEREVDQAKMRFDQKLKFFNDNRAKLKQQVKLIAK